MAFMYTETNLINGYTLKTLPLGFTGSVGYMYNWYDTDNTRWIISTTKCLAITAGTAVMTTRWYYKNGQYFYNNEGSTLFLWWSTTLGLWVVSAKLGGGVAETWVYTNPEDTDAGGSYTGDSWWSLNTKVGTYNPRGSNRGTTEGGYNAANNLAVAVSTVDYFYLTGTSHQGIYTGVGTYVGKSLYVGRKVVKLTGASEDFLFLETWPTSYYPFLSNQAAAPQYVQTTVASLKLDTSYVVSMAPLATSATTFKDSVNGYCSNEVILT
jgi:hypothetical protein